MALDNRFHINALFDAYGRLLTIRQQRLMRLYYHDDLSLGEIADRLRITRQAVHDSLQRSLDELTRFEDHLQLVRNQASQPQTRGGAALRQRIRILAEQTRRVAEEFDDDSLRRISADLDALVHPARRTARTAPDQT